MHVISSPTYHLTTGTKAPAARESFYFSIELQRPRFTLYVLRSTLYGSFYALRSHVSHVCPRRVPNFTCTVLVRVCVSCASRARASARDRARVLVCARDCMRSRACTRDRMLHGTTAWGVVPAPVRHALLMACAWQFYMGCSACPCAPCFKDGTRGGSFAPIGAAGML